MSGKNQGECGAYCYGSGRTYCDREHGHDGPHRKGDFEWTDKRHVKGATMSETGKNNRDYGLIRSFKIDDGELGDASQQECFVLGYELAQVDAAIESGKGILRPIHTANRERIEKNARKHGRDFRITFMHDDVSESWAQLEIAPPTGEKGCGQ